MSKADTELSKLVKNQVSLLIEKIMRLFLVMLTPATAPHLLFFTSVWGTRFVTSPDNHQAFGSQSRSVPKEV